MSKLPPPATGVELYLAAIHEVLCDIRTALVGGGQEQVPTVDPKPVGSTGAAVKRTRTRNRTAEGVS